MLLHPTIFLIGCSLASFISPQYVNSYRYGYAVNDPDGSGNGNSGSSNSGNSNSGNQNTGSQNSVFSGQIEGNSGNSGYVTGNNGQTGGQIVKLGPNGKLLITNCNVCRLCCIGKNVTYEIENVTDERKIDNDNNNNGGSNQYPLVPGYVTPGATPPTNPWSPTTPGAVPPSPTTAGNPETSTVPRFGPYPPSPPPKDQNPRYPYPYYPTPPNPVEQYATAPPPTTVPPPPPCVPTTTTEAPTTTTTSTTTTPRPPCIYTAPPTQPTQPTTLPTATYPTIPTNGYATSPSGYPTAPPPTQTTVIPEYPVPEWPTTAPQPTTTPGAEIPPGPNGECCYIDLRTIQAIVSCGAFGGSQKGCCSKSCSSQSTPQIQRQIQINFQLLSRYFGQIPTRISCTNAVKFGIVESRDIDGVCPPTYTSFPPVELPEDEQPTTVITPGPEVVIPTNGPSDAYVVPKSSVAAASVLTVILATVLCL
ncbi:hypothetical protein B9Z55_008073 [Caenorhabditis nigoni]|uniref:Uncharacterized protein n=1 Tax=Caenorhabditis nigoni TaxID=1611254 RepID=A0A2G5VCJ6_9PELO|nr:hypothetical protein B9Z55_008073 [Caenorhabditis nigoni]